MNTLSPVKKTVIGLVALSLLALTGCGKDAPEPANPGPGGNIRSVYYTTTHGTRIECVYLTQDNNQSSTGGPACWPVTVNGAPLEKQEG